MDKFTKEQRSKIMGAIRGTGTKEEILLAKTLWKLGYRYRKNFRKVMGTPDICFKKYKVAVFVDGEFWHGANWDVRKHKILTNREYWIPKIERNIQKDKEVNTFLVANGWTVLRFWSTEVKKHLEDCVTAVKEAIAARQMSNHR